MLMFDGDCWSMWNILIQACEMWILVLLCKNEKEKKWNKY